MPSDCHDKTDHSSNIYSPPTHSTPANCSQRFEQLLSSDLSSNKRAIIELLLKRSLEHPLHNPPHTEHKPSHLRPSSQSQRANSTLERQAS
ncbi:MAG: hypothetical protein F6K09_12860 [Merismopedia sp. SIO2A8]|nr:hypothetical protein [Merismopedia sp. SIO2A8]